MDLKIPYLLQQSDQTIRGILLLEATLYANFELAGECLGSFGGKC